MDFSNLLESFLNSRVFSIFLGVVLLEFGISRWQKKAFSWKELGLILVISFGIRLVLR